MEKVVTLVSDISNRQQEYDDAIEKLELYPERYKLIHRESWVRNNDGEMVEMIRYLDRGAQPPSSRLK